MAKITLTYPATGLTVSLVLTNTTTEVVDFSGVANEIGATGVYEYTFTEAALTDYAYIATVPGYNPMKGIIYQDSASGGGGLTAPQAAQLAATVKKGDTLLNLGDIILPL